MNIEISCRYITEVKPNSDHKNLLTVKVEGADYEAIISKIIDAKGIDALLNLLTERQIHQHLKNRL